MPMQNLSTVKVVNALAEFTFECVLRFRSVQRRLEAGSLKAAVTRMVMRREADIADLEKEVVRLGGVLMSEQALLARIQARPSIAPPPEDDADLPAYVGLLSLVLSQRHAHALRQNPPLRVEVLLAELDQSVRSDLKAVDGALGKVPALAAVGAGLPTSRCA